jgi:hypothetical protein
MRLLQRNHVISREGFVHQSWTIVYPNENPKNPSYRDLVLTFDVRSDKEVPSLFGMYREEDYKKRIADVTYIQESLLDDNPDKNPKYKSRRD